MNELATRAEITKLAAVLGVEPSRLQNLSGVGPAELRALRNQVNDMLFESDRKRLAGIARLIERLPDSFVARLAVAAIPPELSARVAGVVDEHQAVSVAKLMPATYLADVTPYIDPRQVRLIFALMPSEIASTVVAILRERSDFISLGRLLSYLPDEAVTETTASLSNSELIQTCFVLEEPERLSAITAAFATDTELVH